MCPEAKIIKMYPESKQVKSEHAHSLKAIEKEMIDIVEQIKSTLKL